MFFAFFLELYSSSSYFRVRGIYAIIRYLIFFHNHRNEMVEPSPPGAVENLLNYIGQDFTQLDPVQIETMLSMGGESPVLVNDEKVLMAFKCGRDMTIFTTKGNFSCLI